MLRRFFHFISSLKLTIITLSVSIVLIFIGTLAQQDLDAFYAQKKYFDTMFVWWNSGDYPAWMVTHHMTWLLSWIPPGRLLPVFPGGYLLGGVLLVNLIVAHAVRFKLSWRKSGIILAHSGLICLLVGGLFTSLWSRDTRMVIAQGATSNYTESLTKQFELAVIDKSDPDHDTVVSIPESFVSGLKTVSNPALPFTVKTLKYLPNAELIPRAQAPSPEPVDKEMQGMGTRMVAQELPATNRPGEDNYPAAFVELDTPSGTLGKWLLWAAPMDDSMTTQNVTVDGKTYGLQFRLKRFYKPYQIHLIHLTHEIYAGTDIPRNFASKITLNDPEHGEHRDVLIYMNHPLRYNGETFYQYQTLGADDKFSVFEVVKNPSWWLPYLSCLLVFVGLVIQFGMHLVKFTKKRMAAA